MNKVVAALVIVLAVTLIPLMSISKDTKADTLVLSQDNLLVLNSEVNGDSVGALILKAKELDAKLSGRMNIGGNKTPLYLYLSTPGGSVSSGLELIEALKGLGRPVHTITAFSASMGFQIAENLDTRYILQTGVMMSHRAAGEFSGSFGGISPSQLDQRIHLYVQITKEMDQTTVNRTNGKQTLESYQKAYASELWMTGQESIDGGYADAIIKVKCDKSLSGTTAHQTEFMGLPITYELDNCPINSAPINVKVGTLPGMTSEYVNTIKRQFLSGYNMKMNTPLPMVF